MRAVTAASMGFMDRPARLVPLHYVAIGGRGPEDVVTAPDGGVLTGVEDGRILRLDGLGDPDTARVRELARTGGRPLGLELLTDGDLLVCDAERGLLRVGLADGAVRVLADSAEGEPLRFASNVVALPDGTVYFTASSRRFPLDHWIGDIVEHSATGRLLRLVPGASAPEVVCDGLQFANGLAVSGDGTFLIVAETGAYRLTRFWLTGPRAGRAEFFAELPGMPDNMWRDGELTWVALAGPRNAPLDLFHRTPPAVRRAAARAAVHAPYRPAGTLAVVALDDHGRVVRHLARHHCGFRMATSVCVSGRHLVLGSVREPGVAVCAAPAAK